ncbi:MAG: SpoVR family protein, partial [Bdellovibrionales bacterium]|nr:SpoVR family protein [Bdellovibrionales bacterium]
MRKQELRSLFWVASLMVTLVLQNSWATDEPEFPLSETNISMEAANCSKVLHDNNFLAPTGGRGGHEFIIVPSHPDRDSDTVPVYTEFTQDMSKPGGVLDQLGIPRTKQVIEFLNGREMRTMLATMAAAPVSHYWDGSQIANAMSDTSSMVFEVVYPGSKYNHGYYRDDNPLEWQISIIMHVVGHNHFAHSSGFTQYRSAQATEVAQSLNDAVERAYKEAPKQEVEDFYLYMLSMAQYDDYHTASYNKPEDFSAQSLQDIPLEDMPGQDITQKTKRKADLLARGLRANTENVLSAFVQRIQDDNLIPAWKKEIAALIPHTGHYRPALVHTQVMNEGWASILQELIMKHMGPKWNTQQHWFSAHTVIEGAEDRIKLQDPYWLGVQGWHNLRNKFIKRPEIAELETELEKDRAFIEYADGLIRTMSDYEFLDLALDDKWIQRKKLSIVRRATPQEARRLPPPPPNMPEPEPMMIVSKDPERVRKSIIEKVVGGKTRFNPRLKLRSFSRAGTGELDLTINDEVGSEIPVNRKSVGAALYSIANSLNQPASFEATYGYFVKKTQQEIWDEYEEHWANWDPANPTPLPDIKPFRIAKGRYRTVVYPNGEFRMYDLNTDEQAAPELPFDNPLYAEIEQHLHSYITLLHLEDDDRLDQIASQNPRYQRVSMHSLEQTLNGMPILGLIDHVPTAGKAIMAYHNKVKARMMKAFELAMKGQGSMVKSGNSMFLQALPGPMSIQFDGEYLQYLAENAEPTPADMGMHFGEDILSEFEYGSQFVAHSGNSFELPTISWLPARNQTQKNPFDGDLTGEHLPTDLGPGNGGWRPGGGGGGKGKPKPGDGDPDDGDGGEMPGEG